MVVEVRTRSEGWMQREGVGPGSWGASCGPEGGLWDPGMDWAVEDRHSYLHPGKDASVERFEDATAGAYLT